MSKIQGSNNLQQINLLAETVIQTQSNTLTQSPSQPTIAPNNESLANTQAFKSGVVLTSAQVQIARNQSSADATNIVNRLTSQPRQAGVRELIQNLENKPASYRAEVINQLVSRDVERASALLSQGGSSPVLAAALKDAYNSKGANGGNFLYNIIKNGIGANALTSGDRGYGIGQLVAQSGSENMIRDFSSKSLTLAHQLRANKSNPQAGQVAVGLTNGALNAAAGNSTVLKDLINSGKINYSDIAASASSSADSLGKALDTAAKGGFGTNFFLNVAGVSGQVNSDSVKNSMVNYFNTMGGQLVNRLTASTDGSANAAKLSEFFGKIALPDENRRNSVFSANGGFGKAVASALNQVGRPVTAGTALGNLVGALERGLSQFRTTTDGATNLKNQVIGLLNKIPIAGGVASSIAKKFAANLANRPVNNAQELGTALNASILDSLIQSAQEAEGNGDARLRDSLIQMRTQYSIERENFSSRNR